MVRDISGLKIRRLYVLLQSNLYVGVYRCLPVLVIVSDDNSEWSLRDTSKWSLVSDTINEGLVSEIMLWCLGDNTDSLKISLGNILKWILGYTFCFGA